MTLLVGGALCLALPHGNLLVIATGIGSLGCLLAFEILWHVKRSLTITLTAHWIEIANGFGRTVDEVSWCEVDSIVLRERELDGRQHRVMWIRRKTGWTTTVGLPSSLSDETVATRLREWGVVCDIWRESIEGELPTEADLNECDDAEGPYAAKYFLGKSLEDAEAMFAESDWLIGYLMFMGPKAFRYYVRAAIDYICSERATGDASSISALEGVITLWEEFRRPEIEPIIDDLRAVVDFVLDNWDRFFIEEGQERIFGDVKPAYRVLRRKLS